MSRGGLGIGKKDRWSFFLLAKSQFVGQIVQVVLNLLESCFKFLKDLGWKLSDIKVVTYPYKYIIFSLLLYVSEKVFMNSLLTHLLLPEPYSLETFQYSLCSKSLATGIRFLQKSLASNVLREKWKDSCVLDLEVFVFGVFQ